jgi:excisionase family DNA binding protein
MSNPTPPEAATLPQAPPELIDRHEAARRLSLSVRTIDELIASGDLSVVRIGRTVRIRPSAIAYFVEARETRGRRKGGRP